MAANPAEQYEAGALVSSPSQHHINLVSRRDKIIVATYPITIQYTKDIPEYTGVIIHNFSSEVLTLHGWKIWEGSRSNIFPEEIPKCQVREFKHQADAGGEVIGSVAALVYLIGDGPKWIIAWSNTKNEVNKVYSLILEDKMVKWDKIKDKLDKSGQHNAPFNHSYFADIVIDPTSPTPTVKATLQQFSLDDMITKGQKHKLALLADQTVAVRLSK